MITAGKVSETLVLDGIKWGMGILLVLLYGSVHSQLEQYNPIIIYTSLILYILLFLADFIPSYRHKEKTDIQFKLFLYIGSLCLFFILVFLLKAPQYTASHTPFIISFCFFITGRLLLESNLNRMIQREKKLIKSLGFAATGILIEKPGGDAVNFIIILNKNLRQGKGLWVPPGGHFLPHIDNPGTKLKNKIYEEIGVDCEVMCEEGQKPSEVHDTITNEVEWLVPPAFLLKEFLPDQCKQHHSHHFDLIYLCTTDGKVKNKTCKYKSSALVRIPLKECLDSFEATERALNKKIREKANELGLETYSRNENVSRDLIWRLHLAANKYLSNQK